MAAGTQPIAVEQLRPVYRQILEYSLSQITSE